MKNTYPKEQRYPEIIGTVLAATTRMVAESECKLTLAAVAKVTNTPTETMRAIFPKVDMLLDALYLEAGCARRMEELPAIGNGNCGR